MLGIAGRRLLRLNEQQLILPVESCAQRVAVRDRLPQVSRFDRRSGAGDLNDGGIEGRRAIKRAGCSNDAIDAEHARFDHVAG
jgi:hypothetical protein